MAKKKKKNKSVESVSCECESTQTPEGFTDEVLTGTSCRCSNSLDNEILETSNLSIFAENGE